jgi:hypothetical protein
LFDVFWLSAETAVVFSTTGRAKALVPIIMVCLIKSLLDIFPISGLKKILTVHNFHFRVGESIHNSDLKAIPSNFIFLVELVQTGAFLREMNVLTKINFQTSRLIVDIILERGIGEKT